MTRVLAPVAIGAGNGREGQSCCSSVVVMQTTQDRDGHDGHRRGGHPRRFSLSGDGLRYSLVRSRCIEVGAVRAQDMEQLTLMENEEVIEAFAPDATQKPLADGVRARCPDGRAQHLDPAARRDTGELRTEFGIVVTDQEARRHPKRRGLTQLLGDPRVGRVPRDTDMDNPTRAQVDDEEREECAETQVDDWQEVARLHGIGVVMEERRPRLATRARRAYPAHVALNGALADPDPELEEFTTDALRAPQPILLRHPFDQRDRRRGHLWPL